MLVINGIKASEEDARALCEAVKAGAVRVIYHRIGCPYTNIITN